MPPRLLRPTASPALAIALAWVLVFASALGLMHRTLHMHAGGGHAVAVDAPAPDRGHAADAHGAEPFAHAAHHGLAALFDDHEDGSALCLILDQLQHDAATPTIVLLTLPTLPPAGVLAFMQGEALRRWVALFDARGPPVTR
ncbi:hypothetical protein DFR41_112123 [Pseudacidovorax intermedius]|uniref:Uncharacterized protein n=1 Tax=Pseudacidovorax intermedius TaxID=433924 RepID=A0A370FB35_9BURK|nr:hypothetical protein DFR41_112123 [Pseudacidovorax intermedius]